MFVGLVVRLVILFVLRFFLNLTVSVRANQTHDTDGLKSGTFFFPGFLVFALCTKAPPGGWLKEKKKKTKAAPLYKSHGSGRWKTSSGS